MKSGGWARNHSPLPSQSEPRAGGGGLSHKSPAHVPTPHYPTHAGWDARGPQFGTCPPNSGLTGIGGASSWERRRPRRRPRRPIVIAWNEKRRVGTNHTHLSRRSGSHAQGVGASSMKAPSMSHKSPPPHPCGQGCPRTTNRHLPTSHTTAPCRRGRRGFHGPPPTYANDGDPTDPHQPTPVDHRSAQTKKQLQACGITRCRTTRGRWPGPGQGWWPS